MAEVKKFVAIGEIQQTGANAVEPGIGASGEKVRTYVERWEPGLPITGVIRHSSNTVVSYRPILRDSTPSEKAQSPNNYYAF